VDDLSAVLAEIVTAGQPENQSILTYGGPQPLLIGDIVSDLAALLPRRIVPIPLPVPLLARLATGTGLGRRYRSVHALSMLLAPRAAPDPNDLGLAHRATPWLEALKVAVSRYDVAPEG
jgi:hypothetical protein